MDPEIVDLEADARPRYRESGVTDVSVDTESQRGSAEPGDSLLVTGRPPTAKKPRAKRSAFYARGSLIPTQVLSTITRAGVIPYCIATKSLERPSPTLGDSWRRERFPGLEMPEGRLFMQGVTIEPTAPREIERAAAESTLWFAVAVDAQFGELTDCGGRRRFCENVETTASRELHEESARIFEMIYDTDIVRDSPAVVGEGVCVFFVRVNPRGFGFPDRLAPIFAGVRKHITNGTETAQRLSASMLENSLMYWITSSDLTRLAKTRVPKKTSSTNLQSEASHYYHASNFVPVKPSAFSLPAWMTKTSNALRALSRGVEPTTDGTEPPSKHPVMYETLRRIIAPVADELAAVLTSAD